jgi:hypothetical protein
MMVTRAEHIPSELIEANEGAQDLADEIKLRGENTSEKGTSAGSTVSRKEDQVDQSPTPEPEIAENAANEVAEEVAEVATEEPSEA